MAKIAIVNIGMHGHVNPTLGFTEALVNRGHAVDYYGDQTFAARIQKTGARFQEYGSVIGKTVAERAQLQAADQAAMRASFGKFIDECEHSLPVLLDLLQRGRPDVIVYDFISIAGRMAAEILKIPAVKFFTTYAANEHFDLLACVFNSRLKPSPADAQAFHDRLNALCLRYGCAPVDFASMLTHTEPHNLVFMPRRFQPKGRLFDERFHFVGPCLRAYEKSADLSFLPAGDAPILVISLGTLFHKWPEFYKNCIAAFGNQPWRVAMSVGPHIQPEDLGPIPDNISIQAHLPQLELLRHASLFVSHGGMNSTMEALLFGVPMVVIPQMDEQAVTAKQIAELGLGRHLDRETITAGQLFEAVTQVAGDKNIKKNIAAMQADVLQAGGTAHAVNVIEAAAQVRHSESDRRRASPPTQEQSSEL